MALSIRAFGGRSRRLVESRPVLLSATGFVSLPDVLESFGKGLRFYGAVDVAGVLAKTNW